MSMMLAIACCCGSPPPGDCPIDCSSCPLIKTCAVVDVVVRAVVSGIVHHFNDVVDLSRDGNNCAWTGTITSDQGREWRITLACRPQFDGWSIIMGLLEGVTYTSRQIAACPVDGEYSFEVFDDGRGQFELINAGEVTLS